MCLELLLSSPSKSRPSSGKVTSSSVRAAGPQGYRKDRPDISRYVKPGIWQGVCYMETDGTPGKRRRRFWFNGQRHDTVRYADGRVYMWYLNAVRQCHPIGVDHLALEMDDHAVLVCGHHFSQTSSIEAISLPVSPHQTLPRFHRRHPTEREPYLPSHEMQYDNLSEQSSPSSISSWGSILKYPGSLRRLRGRERQGRHEHRPTHINLHTRAVIIDQPRERARTRPRGRSRQCHHYRRSSASREVHRTYSPDQYTLAYVRSRRGSPSGDRLGRRHRSISHCRRPWE